MLKDAKKLLFELLALTLLVVGCLGAQALWKATHHRYDNPNSGYYHGSVNATFSGTDDEIYSFHFQGQSKPRWQWTYSTNFIYRSIQFKWQRFDAQTDLSEDSGTLRLPSLAYESLHSTGILTRVLLSEWLLGTTNGTPAGARSVDTIFGFIEDAGRGTLPAPNHHGYHFEQPARGHIQHFRLGSGIGGLVYIWIGVWLVLVMVIARRFLRKCDGTNQ